MKRFFLLAALAIGMSAAGFATDKAKVVAHRGHWKPAGSAQNSIRSLVKADSIGCWGSEFDVWRTADGKLVVNHDGVHDGVVIQTSNAKEVTALKLSNGEKLPLLKDYLNTFRKHPNLKVVCELKSHKDAEAERMAVHEILKMTKKKGLEKRVVYISFSLPAVKEFIKYAPKGTEVYYLNGELSPKELKAIGCAGPDYPLYILKGNPSWIKECHDLGMKVNIWTVDKKEDLQWCIDNGADFITTNNPEELQQMLK